ncbi:UNVERIFIED_CONTAM: proline-rich protein [Sesamum radiatum]|uniref:Proline-rich protein n=1 Tax=Sesamum radiatum TaxID=300843 RepID=A0AAW2K4P6_SESRA
MRLGACIDVVGGLMHAGMVSNTMDEACCPVLEGLPVMEAAVCLCNSMKARLLNTALKAKFRHDRGAIANNRFAPKVNTALSNTCTRGREMEQQLATQKRRENEKAVVFREERK